MGYPPELFVLSSQHQPKTELRRMWINQPSKLQPHHCLHGVNVLAQEEHAGTYRVYFLSGDIISQQMTASTLSEGWKPGLDAALREGEIIRLANDAAPHSDRDNDLFYIRMARAVEKAHGIVKSATDKRA